MNQKSGIYSFRCLINNKRNIGSCEDFEDRENEHFGDLRRKSHSNKLLQKDYNKYGKINFVFEILERLPLDDNLLLEKENFYMDLFQTHIPTYGNGFGYNQRRATRRSNPDTKQKISNSLLGKRLPDSAIDKISKSSKGSNNGNCKHSKDKYMQIIKAINSGMPTDEIIKKYSISIATFNRLKSGNHWIFRED